MSEPELKIESQIPQGVRASARWHGSLWAVQLDFQPPLADLLSGSSRESAWVDAIQDDRRGRLGGRTIIRCHWKGLAMRPHCLRVLGHQVQLLLCPWEQRPVGQQRLLQLPGKVRAMLIGQAEEVRLWRLSQHGRQGLEVHATGGRVNLRPGPHEAWEQVTLPGPGRHMRCHSSIDRREAELLCSGFDLWAELRAVEVRRTGEQEQLARPQERTLQA